MNIGYKSKYCTIEELVPKEMLAECGEEKCWWFLDKEMLMGLDNLKDVTAKEYGIAITDVRLRVNNWKGGGDLDERGIRNPMTSTGAKWSIHKFARAVDVVIEIRKNGQWKALTGDEMRKIARKYHLFIGCTCIELGTSTWLHMDWRNCQPLMEVPFK